MQIKLLQPLARFIFGKPERKLLKAYRHTSSPTHDEDTMRELRKLLRKGPPQSQETIDAVNNAMNSLYRFRPTQLFLAATFTLNLMESAAPEWSKCLSAHLQMLRVESSACFSPKSTYDFFYNYARTTQNDASMTAATRLAINTLKTVGRTAPASEVVQAAEDCMHLVLNLDNLPQSTYICELASDCVFGLSTALAKELGPAEAAHRIEYATRHHVHSNKPEISNQRKFIVQSLLQQCEQLPHDQLTHRNLLPLAINYADTSEAGRKIMLWTASTVLPLYIGEYGLKDGDVHARRLFEKSRPNDCRECRLTQKVITGLFGSRLGLLAAEAGSEQALHWAMVIGAHTPNVIKFTKAHLPLILYRGAANAFAKLVAPVVASEEFKQFRKLLPNADQMRLNTYMAHMAPVAA